MGGGASEAFSGRFRNPRDAQGIMTLPLMREPKPEEMDPSSIAVLMIRRLAKRTITGTVHFRYANKSVQLPILGGIAYMRNPEKMEIIRAFAWPEGTYCLDLTPPDRKRRNRFSMGRLVMEGLRAIVRGFDVATVEEALGKRMQLAPKVRQDRSYVLELGLTEPEKRLVRLQMNGERSVEEVASRSGVGRQTTVQLLMLLGVFDCVQWLEPKITDETSLAKRLEDSATRMEKANYFDALDVHWSLDTDEIEAAYQKLRRKLQRGGLWDRTAPEACARMRRVAEEAFALLSDPARRAAYRNEVYPRIFYEAASQLVDGQIKAYQLRTDKNGLKEAIKTKQELARGARMADADAASPSGRRPKPDDD